MTPNQSLGRLIRTRRKAKKLSQTEFGKLIGLHQGSVCRVELGTQCLTPEELLAVSDALKIPFKLFEAALREGGAQ